MEQFGNLCKKEPQIMQNTQKKEEKIEAPLQF